MKLLVDIGNTRIKWAMVSNGNWSTGAPGSHELQLESLLDQMWCDIPRPDMVVVSNVRGPEFAGSLRRWSEQNWLLTPRLIRPRQAECGVTNCYQDPGQLGSDRWAALIAARDLCKDPLVIVDCGTAVTVDALDEQGFFLGGVIFAGVSLSRNALIDGTKQIDVVPGKSRDVFCQSTEDAIASGTYFGALGAIDRLVDQFNTQLGSEMKAYLSGGDAVSLKPMLSHRFRHEPDLVLKGLNVIVETSA